MDKDCKVKRGQGGFYPGFFSFANALRVETLTSQLSINVLLPYFFPKFSSLCRGFVVIGLEVCMDQKALNCCTLVPVPSINDAL